MKSIVVIALAVLATPALAESPYPTPTRDGRERLQRTGTCPTGYVGVGNKCEALHQDTPRAYPKIKGAACPSGTFSSGDYCKEFR
ncbi:hypothetical protein [Bradyrhizobium elkanii]|jgi:hypothetical protein|uniref:Uncharacterized protein n=1 Tax=Bradyrhizobium elkanii TaxID=29448 RepID=A0ABV4F0D7_BRAEL|nr:hypothetical protein [Bradyrhizobium elkanii]MCP1757906.1 hypothetical protein [Bradyrhizobium elkanii]MCS3881797.1 hypothetical protein [Bradyrhizobium elkanii]MCS4218556.1 hypothetical protein [Bradyrhizobium elkanii]MCW2110147.1 hypothetical protein [Bradyrhizobium elkanii]MCW2201485.1 hypothetical protein [Bradyrhizobium elkanii]